MFAEEQEAKRIVLVEPDYVHPDRDPQVMGPRGSASSVHALPLSHHSRELGNHVKMKVVPSGFLLDLISRMELMNITRAASFESYQLDAFVSLFPELLVMHMVDQNLEKLSGHGASQNRLTVSCIYVTDTNELFQETKGVWEKLESRSDSFDAADFRRMDSRESKSRPSRACKRTSSKSSFRTPLLDVKPDICDSEDEDEDLEGAAARRQKAGYNNGTSHGVPARKNTSAFTPSGLSSRFFAVAKSGLGLSFGGKSGTPRAAKGCSPC